MKQSLPFVFALHILGSGAPLAMPKPVSSPSQVGASISATGTSLLSGVRPAFLDSTYKPLPGRIEAEAYAAMNNAGTGSTADEGGGQEVGWLSDGAWMDYNVSVPTAGFYTFVFRLANGFSDNARLDLRAADGSLLGGLDVPRTGGMSNFSTARTVVSLPAGNQTIRVAATRGVWSLNWFDVLGAKALPGKIEAEAVDLSSDVRSETTSDDGGGLNMTWIDDGDWFDYNVNVPTAGTYTVNMRVANSYGNGRIELRSASGSVFGGIDVPRTHGWQNWITINTVVTLPAGNQLLRFYAVRGAWNFNWFDVVSGGIIKQPSVINFAALPDRTEDDSVFDLAATSNNTESPITFTSSNPSVVSVSNASGSWKATVQAIGSATITASQAASTSFLAAADVARTQVVNTTVALAANRKIPIDAKRWYQLNNVSNGLDGLFDGITNVNVETGWGKILSNYDAWYPLLPGESMTIDNIRLYDFTGTFQDTPMTLSIITDQWQRIPIATFTGSYFDTWLGPYPDRQPNGNVRFKLDTPISNARYLVINSWSNFPTEIELYGSYTPPTQTYTAAPYKPVKLKDMLGVNAYEWNFQHGNTPWQIHEAKMNVVKSFAGVRHYMDWNKLELTEGSYTYNPVWSGGWHYDLIYERCKAEGIEVLACLKTLPEWMVDTYPDGQKDTENVPVRYGKDFSDPLSYIEQAKVGFQYVARYGSNPNVNPALLSVNSTPRWTGDNPNTIKIGMGLIKYIECENERDKWWKGRKAYQTAREYAANLSAFYDGHKNTMGPGVGVKNADPNIKVVIGGLASASIGSDYVKGMIDWCKQYRGYKPDGTVNLCWDVINYHMYSDNTSSSQSGSSTRGAAPEVTPINRVALDFMKTAHNQSYGMPVWVTETGYDVHQSSPLRAIPIGSKSALETQADWILRTSLFYARLGIERVYFYQLYDDNETGGMFATSGLANGDQTRRPAADYILQTKKLFGEYTYKQTIHGDPIVDRYEWNGKSMYALVVPDEIGRTASYTLDLGTVTSATVYRPQVGDSNMVAQQLPTTQGKLTLTVTETPMFVVPSTGSARLAAEPALTETGEASVRVFPNPAVNTVTISLKNENPAPVSVNLFDAASGRLYRQATLRKDGSTASGEIDVTSLPVGVYIVEIQQGDNRIFRKLLKAK